MAHTYGWAIKVWLGKEPRLLPHTVHATRREAIKDFMKNWDQERYSWRKLRRGGGYQCVMVYIDDGVGE